MAKKLTKGKRNYLLALIADWTLRYESEQFRKRITRGLKHDVARNSRRS